MHVPAHEHCWQPVAGEGTKYIKLNLIMCAGLWLYGQVGCPIDLHARCGK